MAQRVAIATQEERDRYLNAVAAAERLGVTERFMRRLVAERRIPFHKLGYHVRFKVSDLDAFAAAGRVEPWDVA